MPDDNVLRGKFTAKAHNPEDIVFLDVVVRGDKSLKMQSLYDIMRLVNPEPRLGDKGIRIKPDREDPKCLIVRMLDVTDFSLATQRGIEAIVKEMGCVDLLVLGNRNRDTKGYDDIVIFEHI